MITEEDKNKLIATLILQLQEKEKEIEKWKTKWCESEKNSLRLYEQNLNKNQDKISFAVEKLKEVKKLFEEKYTYDVEESDFAVVYEDDVDEIIDNQIKELKEMK